MNNAGTLDWQTQPTNTLLVYAIIGAALIFLSFGMGNEMSRPMARSTSANAQTVSFSRDVQPILNANCVLCHQGGSGPAGLSLEPGISFASLVGAKSTESNLMRVMPGSPGTSYLVLKLLGTHIQAGGSGDRMPFGYTPFPPSSMGIITQWILSGAPNN
jgi:hypothetical protein